jgi:hypothetical protein
MLPKPRCSAGEKAKLRAAKNWPKKGAEKGDVRDCCMRHH